jgi:tetratricopeptide (TPR) repeat protein
MSQEAIDTWLVSASDSLQYFPASQSLRKEMLRKAAADYALLSQGTSQDPQMELERLKALVRLGEIQLDQESYAEAQATFESARKELQKKLPLITPIAQELVVPWKAEIARVATKSAIASYNAGERNAAVAEFELAIAELRTLRVDNPNDLNANSYLAYTLDSLAQLLIADGEYGRSLPLLQESERTLKKLPPESAILRLCQNGLLQANCLSKLGRQSESRQLLESNLLRLKADASMESDNPQWVEWHVVLRKSFEHLTFEHVPGLHHSIVLLLPTLSLSWFEAIRSVGNSMGSHSVEQLVI